VWSAACSVTAETEKIIRKKFNFGIKKRCFSAAKTFFQSVKQSEFSSKKRFFQKLKICLYEKRARDLKLKTVYFQRLLDDFHRNENRILILAVSDKLNTVFNFIFSNTH
jgi:DNA-binding transcriptional regulator GbsR (MarR family)